MAGARTLTTPAPRKRADAGSAPISNGPGAGQGGRENPTAGPPRAGAGIRFATGRPAGPRRPENTRSAARVASRRAARASGKMLQGGTTFQLNLAFTSNS
jgi:hypothetical protein